MVLSFTKEAEKVISLFLEKLDRKIDELGFEMSDERRKDFLLAVYHSLRLSSIRHAKSRRRKVVEEKDAKASFRFLSPKMLIRHGLQNPKIFKHTEKLRTKHFQMIKEKMNSIADAWILDAGCGYGRQLMEFLRHHWKGEFFGVDIDIEAIKYGKSAEPSITFIGGDIHGKLPFKDNSFDAIFCIGVLHLVRDVNKTIQEFARTLKPNGLLFVTSALVENKLIGNMAYLIWKVIPRVGRFHHIDDIKKFLNQNGFTKIIVDKVFPMPLKLGNVYCCTSFLNKT